MPLQNFNAFARVCVFLSKITFFSRYRLSSTDTFLVGEAWLPVLYGRLV